MRRWNGWGDDTINYPLPPNGAKFLEEHVGAATPPQDATLEQVLSSIPPSRLPAHPLISTEPIDRLRHARGQSLPDWVALRSGQIPAFPDGVAFPNTPDEVLALIRYAKDTGVRLIPYGGGTSVVGHINPLPGDPPVLTVNLGRLNQLLSLDEISHLATFGAGVPGPELEAHLRARGFTLGHFPQSFEYSTLGGWVVTRSSGQQSLWYGRIENLFAGGTLISPIGTLHLPPHPASAAGPDLRQLVLGSEGRLGILTDVTVRVSPLPEREVFYAIFFPDFTSGETAVRQMAQARLPLSMLRLSSATETATTLALAGHETLIGTLERLLQIRHIGPEKSLLLLGITGSERLVKATRKSALAIAREYGGVFVGQRFGEQWRKNRFRAPYLRNTLWETGYAVDTLETAVSWHNVQPTMHAIENSLQQALQSEGEHIHVFTHLSHIYTHGASIYTTFLFRLADQPEHTLARWQKLKTAASEAIVAQGGTISHQHGVGTDHAPWLAAEKGPLGMAVLQDVCHRFDPEGIMNPGKLLVPESGGNNNVAA